MSESELTKILGNSLRAIGDLDFNVAATGKVQALEHDSTFGKIISGLHFSRNFIWSYQIVILLLLLLFTVKHWSSKFGAWRRRQTLGKKASEASIPTPRTSSNGTLSGDTSSPEEFHGDQKHEGSPLLRDVNERDSHSRLAALNGRIKGWLMYQPEPIPVVNKTLPSNGCTVSILAFLGLQSFYVFYKVTLSIPMLFVFADRTALVFVANLPLLYLFAAKNQPIKVLTGYSYEALNLLHRKLGEVLCLLALLHSIGMVGVWYTILRPTGSTLGHFLLSKIILLGLGALFAYEVLYFTSLGSFRQRWYELFLGLHVFLQASALILVWFHHHGSRPYVGAALAIFLVDRCLYRWTLKTYNTKASLDVADDNGTVLVHATLPLDKRRRWAGLIKPDITSGWKATEHVFLSMPSLAGKHRIQAHPFTIASKAPTNVDSDGSLDLIIRAHDGFSKDLVDYAESHSSAMIRLDGPYGSQNAVRLLKDCDLSVIVAGGSGVAVTWPLTWSLLESQQATDLEYRTPFTKPVLFIWIVRHQSHISWIGRKSLLELEAAHVDTVIFPPTVEYGHPNLSESISSWIAKYQNLSKTPCKIGLVSSGPDSMNRSVRNLGASLVVAGHNVHVEVEKFGW